MAETSFDFLVSIVGQILLIFKDEVLAKQYSVFTAQDHDGKNFQSRQEMAYKNMNHN